MARLIVEIPDELTARLAADPLPLPVGAYCRAAIEEALIRHQEMLAVRAAEAPEPIDMTGPVLLSVVQAAKLLGSSRDIVDDLIHSGRIAAINLSEGTDKRALWRVPISAIQEMLDRAETNVRE